MFSCHRLGPDEGWHPDDYNVDCDSGTHTGYRIAAVLGVLVYPVGIPVSFLCLLWHDEKTRIEKAKKTGGNVADQSSALDFLRSDYKVGPAQQAIADCFYATFMLGYLAHLPTRWACTCNCIVCCAIGELLLLRGMR